jgi:hypothetical protein
LIKVFLSHQSADSALALQIQRRLASQHGIDSYLDVIDPFIKGRGEDLAEHIQTEMGKCTQLLAIVSVTTRESQWVPWEIGVATEKDFPLATYFSGFSLPPEFLRKWPYLRSDTDLDRYAEASSLAERRRTELRKTVLAESTVRERATGEFFTALRKSLGQ